MSPPHKRRQRKRKGKRQVKHPREVQANSRSRFWERLQGHPASILLGLIGSILTVWLTIPGELGPPQVAPFPGAAQTVFELPFSLRNPHHFTSIKLREITCVVDDANWPKLSLQRISFSVPVAAPLVLPGGAAEYHCPLEKFLKYPGVGLLSAEVHLRIDFTVLGWRRRFKSTPFTWNENAPQWVMGTPID